MGQTLGTNIKKGGDASFEMKLMMLLNSISQSSGQVDPELLENVEDIRNELLEQAGKVQDINSSVNQILENAVSRKQKSLHCQEVTGNVSFANTINGSIYNSGDLDITVDYGNITLKPGMSMSWDSGNGNDTIDVININVPSGGKATVTYVKHAEIDE